MVASTNDDARLPVTLIPNHYDLTYERIDLVNHKFEGRVSIEGVAAKSVSSITLHALDLQVFSATLKPQGDDAKLFTAEEFRYHMKNQTLEMIWSEKEVLTEGSSFVLTLDFKGTLNDQMRGLYRSTFVGMDGKQHTMATTQFEPTDARRAFPCFDEPALKASFCLTVNIPAELACISNTPIASMHTSTSFQATVPTKTITFQKTPKMSSYLLALVVGPEMDGISSTSRQIVTTVYTVPGKALQGVFCLDVASRCLDLYQDLFRIPYPLVKSDLLAIPDFAAGAMENWGANFYREAKILVKPNSTSESMKRGIARTVCHELAHQWFGNLVTMEFWTQLWLKEGVARFMEFVGIDSLFPEWDAWTEFVQSVYGLALSLDSMQSSHPVEVVVTSADEINEIFDAISYAKGASIIRMISSYIGMDTFLEGVRLYLSRHAYGNAVTNDLWRALEEASGFPVVEFMKPWTLEVGYPVLLLSDDGSMTATRFLGSGPEEGPSTRWPIPVTAKVEGVDEVQGPWVVNGLGVGETEEQLSAKLAEWSASGKWFKLNINQTAFFRTNYTKEQWRRLSHVMSPDGPLSVTDRLGLISDSFAAGKAGYSSIVDSLALVEHFGEHETAGEYLVSSLTVRFVSGRNQLLTPCSLAK
jgi:aminopeptidase N